MEIKMKSIHVFLFIITLLSLGACYPASTAPAQIISPEGTIQADTTPLSTTAVTLIPVTEEVFTPTLTKSPIRATNTPEEDNEFPISVTQSLTITIVNDNNPYDQRLSSAWGFSALVEYRDYNLLFDTGGDGQMLMENMRILGIDPSHIDSVVLSHAHEDHTGGLTALLDSGAKPVVYLLPSFPVSFKRQIEQFTQASEVLPGQSFAEGLWTTGEVGGIIPEQALVIQTEQGLVVITGCAHPGIVAIVEQAQILFAEPVYLVLGGFHLGDKSEAEIDAILKDFKRLEVKQVAPCHCTGESAISRFAAEYGKDFIQVGVGSVIRLEASISK
jgi:7,8-dihydropterin-6-yl-methyl-4-(beta-D-ribofuranosyl)aminobenzene 5'-phosphate synthase